MSAYAFWLAALSPLPKIGKGISYSFAITAVAQLVGESRRLMIQDARLAALQAMNQELEQVEIALHTQQQEQALYEIYGAAQTLAPEVKTELTKSLEHLYREDSAEHTISTYTDTSQKNLYLAVKALMEVGCNETYIIEKVLKKRGRSRVSHSCRHKRSTSPFVLYIRKSQRIPFMMFKVSTVIVKEKKHPNICVHSRSPRDEESSLLQELLQSGKENGW